MSIAKAPASSLGHRAAGLALRLGCSLALAGCAADAPPPNIVLVLVDTLRADHLHAYGYGRESTPNLDALFAEGILFENAHSNASCTFPSVNSLLTSRHPMVFVARGDRPTGPAGETGREEIRKHWQSGSRPARFGIPEDIRTLPAILRSQGYSTLAVSASPIVRDTVSDKKEATNRWGGFGQGFDVFHEACLQQDAECVNRAALQLLEDNSAQPFFLYLHYMEPHGPYQPPAGYKRRFATTSRNLSAINNGNPYPYKDQWLADAEQQSDVDARDLQHLIDLYDDEIAYFDEKLAELLGELSARSLDEAILVLASDHGEAFAEHGVMAHCQTLFEPEVRVPLFMRWPGGPTGLRVRQAAQNLDVAPTILDLAGIDYDAERFDGRSLRRLVADENAAPAPRYVFAAQRAFRSVNDDRYKLVVDLLTREMKLFDLEADPAELFDLAESEQREFRRLRRELVDFLNETEGGVGTKNSLEKGRKVEEALEALGYLQ